MHEVPATGSNGNPPSVLFPAPQDPDTGRHVPSIQLIPHTGGGLLGIDGGWGVVESGGWGVVEAGGWGVVEAGGWGVVESGGWVGVPPVEPGLLEGDGFGEPDGHL